MATMTKLYKAHGGVLVSVPENDDSVEVAIEAIEKARHALLKAWSANGQQFHSPEYQQAYDALQGALNALLG